MSLLKKIRAWLCTTTGPDARHNLHSVERMRAILERERMRADRGSSYFALLSFTLANHEVARTLDDLGGILGRRVRATDDAGMLGPRSVGVVLPETPAAGAWKLAQDVLDRLPREIQPPKCDVFIYPGPSCPKNNAAERQPATDVEVLAGVGSTAQPMEPWFAQPMSRSKRAIDVAGASAVLLLASPLMMLVALAIKVTSRGSIIFSQPRDTLGGRRFTMYKFRTMIADAEASKAALRQFSEQDGPAFKMANDPRITRLGRWLRVTSIDELPQLFNVLLGDMSLVGPRPLPCDESGGCEIWQRRRLDVTPGITCIWQVYGRSTVSFAEWIRMDIRYVRSRSLFTDLQLIAQTVPAVVLRRGAR
jgi:lipopolysaccharide/colanic/teichoic acid biosynthesis glycosyltransferase